MLKYNEKYDVSALYFLQRYGMIGRKEEQRILRELALSGESEFVVIYGRRRVGKTFLVRETFGGNFFIAA
jgi:predicted AAA+ superfamily ATPase